MIDRQLLVEAHKGLERASECLRREMLYAATVKEARTNAEEAVRKLLKLEDQLSDKKETKPI